MGDRRWQLQEAKQRFSELIRLVESEGPQIVTRHGEEIAVVVDVMEWRRLNDNADTDFKLFLRDEPELDDREADALEVARSRVPARVVDFGEDA
jgi:prevent-host-death family protein